MKELAKKNPNNERYQFWQQNYHPVELSTNEMLDQKLGYIHYNPVKEGIVGNPEEYLYSSAKDYFKEEKGLIDLIFVS